ncbi:MAG: hypothetical protein L0F84_05475 [Lactococcus raffinolactis]|nr:hypothetical protein [Lactococcus raffinolactis]
MEKKDTKEARTKEYHFFKWKALFSKSIFTGIDHHRIKRKKFQSKMNILAQCICRYNSGLVNEKTDIEE